MQNVVTTEDMKRHIDQCGADCAIEAAVLTGTDKKVLIETMTYIDECSSFSKIRRFIKRSPEKRVEKIVRTLASRGV